MPNSLGVSDLVPGNLVPTILNLRFGAYNFVSRRFSAQISFCAWEISCLVDLVPKIQFCAQMFDFFRDLVPKILSLRFSAYDLVPKREI